MSGRQKVPTRRGRSSAAPARVGARRLGVRIAATGGAEGVRRRLRAAARAALQAEGRVTGRLDITVVDADEMRRQHRRWMGLGSATDVLTFDLSDGDGTTDRVEGQILVCADVARREAGLRELDWRDELTLYVVHGCLHLCGYDDRTKRDFRRMHRREDEILTELGLGPVFSGRRA